MPTQTPTTARPLKDAPGTVEQVTTLCAAFLASDEAGHITLTPVWIGRGETVVAG